MLDRKVKVNGIQDLGAHNYLLTLKATEQARLTRPGQFVMIKCSPVVTEEPLLRRPFSVFQLQRNPKSGRLSGLEVLVKDVGSGTHKLARMRRGEYLHVLGPQGRAFELSPNSRMDIRLACLVAGGVGIAALFLLAQELLNKKITPVLIYGGRSSTDLVLREQFEGLGIQTFYATEDGSLGETGLVTAMLDRFLRPIGKERVKIYSCGPWRMMQATHEIATRYKIPCEVSLEARMGCSLGACMGCVVHGWEPSGEEQYFRVCTEGAVMNSQNVDWTVPPL